MAVEAQHMNVFPQLISNRECVKSQPNMNNVQVEFAGVPANTVVSRPLYGQSLAVDPISITAAKPCINRSDSGVTFQIHPSSAPRKRQRDPAFCDSDALLASAVAQKRRTAGFGSLIDQEMVSQIQQQQSEIDRFVAQQTEKLRMELEERQRTQTRMLASAIQNAVAKKLKEKDEEIVRMGKLNWVLQERVKNLYMENQIWRDLAQTNEATANNLRTNLEQVLAQVDAGAVDDHRPSAAAAVDDDAESSCGSCCVGNDDENEKNEVAGAAVSVRRRKSPAVGGGCRRCGSREASVLVLPCRHLCLCTVCGSALLRTCPVCDTVMNASVHVNMS